MILKNKTGVELEKLTTPWEIKSLCTYTVKNEEIKRNLDDKFWLFLTGLRQGRHVILRKMEEGGRAIDVNDGNDFKNNNSNKRCKS